MCLCVNILLFSFILKKSHDSVTIDFTTFVVRGFQSLFKGVFTLVKDILVISESIYYFVFSLYAGTFGAFHRNHSFFLFYWNKEEGVGLFSHNFHYFFQTQFAQFIEYIAIKATYDKSNLHWDQQGT